MRALLILAGAQVAIGAAAIFARFALVASGPLWVGALRLAIGSLPVVALALARRSYRIGDPMTERRLGVAGIILAAHFGTWIASLQHASVAVATLLVCSTPVFTEAWTIARTGRIRPLGLAGIVVAGAGVAAVVGIPNHTETPLGIALATTGAIAMAAYLLLVRASDPRYDTLAVVGRTFPLAAAVLAAAAFLGHDRLPPLHATAAWGGILAMALVSQVFGHTALAAAVRELSATLVATATLLEPLVAALLAAAIFSERLAPGTLFGALLILGGIALAIRAEYDVQQPTDKARMTTDA